MSASMMLKTLQNRIIGYVLLLDGQLYVRAEGCGESAELGVGYEKVGWMEYSIICDGEERAVCQSDRELKAAYIRAGNLVLATTGKYAEAAACDAAEKKEKENQPFKEKECKKEAGKGVSIERGFNDKAYSCRQNRWPPPPCWPSARYIDGAWKEGE